MYNLTMDRQLLAIKLFPPVVKPGVVSRPRLLDFLSSGFKENRKLTLISAPAGYGKSTLIAEWLTGLSESKKFPEGEQSFDYYSWLTLDQFDNDPVRFLSYWLAAFRKIDATIGQRFENLLKLPQIPSPSEMMDELLNDLIQMKTRATIVFDDFHLMNNPYITESLDYFFDHQPAQIHLVLITRSDPQLSLSRMRARKQMTELRARDLRFTKTETHQFLTQTMNNPMSDELIQMLDLRTEGWPTGLQLAALALQNIHDVEAFIDSFHGSHRYVLDYLAEEVMNQQSEEIRTFLCKTSILEQFNAPLCETITGYKNSQSILHSIEKSNLFLIPLDNESVWYRYHHLFADYLRVGLNLSETKELHKKAALWFAENGSVFEAMQHALLTTDFNFIADLMERSLQKGYTWSGGNLSALLSWLDALPKSILYSRPLLCLLAVPIVSIAARFDQAEQLLIQTEIALRNQDSPDTRRMMAMVVLYRGGIALMQGEIEKAILLTSEAQTLLPADDFLFQARAAYNLAQAYELKGEIHKAIHIYQKTSELGFASEATFLAVNAQCAMAFGLRTAGKHQLAINTCQQAIEIVKGDPIPPQGMAYIIMGIIAHDQGNLTQAEQWLQEGIDLSRQGGLVDDINWGNIFLCGVKLALGDLSGAQNVIEQAMMMIHSYHIPRISLLASAFQAQFFLLTNQIEKTKAWAVEYKNQRETVSVEYLREIEDITLARILIESGEKKSITDLLEPLVENARIKGRVIPCVEALILLSLFYLRRNIPEKALNLLEEAVSLAAPERLIRPFIEYQDIQELIVKLRSSAPQFIDRILEIKNSLTHPNDFLANLPEPLSEQEMKVLHLILQGKSNQEIAKELFISVGTAKWHVHNVFQKIGVNNRLQAIALAREWGLNS